MADFIKDRAGSDRAPASVNTGQLGETEFACDDKLSMYEALRGMQSMPGSWQMPGIVLSSSLLRSRSCVILLDPRVSLNGFLAHVNSSQVRSSR
jgi:hypothetical protein